MVVDAQSTSANDVRGRKQMEIQLRGLWCQRRSVEVRARGVRGYEGVMEHRTTGGPKLNAGIPGFVVYGLSSCRSSIGIGDATVLLLCEIEGDGKGREERDAGR